MKTLKTIKIKFCLMIGKIIQIKIKSDIKVHKVMKINLIKRR